MNTNVLQKSVISKECATEESKLIQRMLSSNEEYKNRFYSSQSSNRFSPCKL